MTNIKTYRILLLTLLFTFVILSILFLNPSSDNTRIPTSRTEHVEIEKYPGAYVQYLHPIPSNVSYCNFKYGLPNDLNYAKHVKNGPELGEKSDYRIIYNVIDATENGDVPSITYATHVTADFVNYIPELLRYWDGFISVAAFVPDTDVALVLEQINQYCYCLPGMSRVSVHLVFPRGLPPSIRDVYFTESSDCKLEDMSSVQTLRDFDENIIYPVNVMRNAARTAALTDNVLVSDIQLMPSEDVATRFCKMLDKYKFIDYPHKVYVVPIFEIEATEEIPRTKKELVKLVSDKKAVYFHKLVCSHCQKFPAMDLWMNTKPGNFVKPLVAVKREVPFHRWEPIYIGTKNEPLYNERLSWEGLQDKMMQMLEMCLIGYKLVILDGAFMVHWPGIKKPKTSEGDAWKTKYIKQNSREYNIILGRLLKEYQPNPQCKLQ